MLKRITMLILCLGFLFGQGGCAAKITPLAPAPASTASATPAAKTAAGWEALLSVAQKEGKVNLYASGLIPATRDAIIKAFKEKYGIDVEVTTGPGGQIVERLTRETRAGLYIPDIGMSGSGTLSTLIKPLALLQPLDQLLVSPEVTDPGKWRGGKIPYFDDAHEAVSLVMYSAPQVTLNTQLVRTGEITSYYDLLAPKWKGQILLHDPTIPGGGAQWVGFMVHKFLGMEKGLAYMREFARQEPIMSRDHRQMAEWVAK